MYESSGEFQPIWGGRQRREVVVELKMELFQRSNDLDGLHRLNCGRRVLLFDCAFHGETA